MSPALWLPFLWVTISGSRFLSEWLYIMGVNFQGSSVEEGSIVDAIFFFAIIIAGFRVLAKRKINWQQVIRQNAWVSIYFAYCLISVVWSEYPLVAFKRWIKLLGQPVMVLIILTEPDPVKALMSTLKRSAYLLLPLSVAFIKYFPEFSRSFDSWTGTPTNTGVTKDKNALGAYCMVVGHIFFWELARIYRTPKFPGRFTQLMIMVGMLGMLVWLMHMANSATSISTLVLGIVIMVGLSMKWVSKKHFGTFVIAAIATAALLEMTFGISQLGFASLGRNSTLTGRTEIWDRLLAANDQPILGYGFESFWLGGRRSAFTEGFVFELNSAHNGYLETVLNIGIVGLIITLCMLLSTFSRGCKELLNDFRFGQLRIAYLFAFMVYNWTEAAFRTHIVPFFLFFVIAIEYRNRAPAIEQGAEIESG